MASFSLAWDIHFVSILSYTQFFLPDLPLQTIMEQPLGPLVSYNELGTDPRWTLTPAALGKKCERRSVVDASINVPDECSHLVIQVN